MGIWADLINTLTGDNFVTGRKNTAANARAVLTGVADAVAFLEGLARGAKILHGAGIPDAAKGIEGDAYLDSTTSDFYFKENGDWDLVVVLRGKDGLDGKPGRNGRTPVLGIDYTVTNGTDGKSAYEVWLAAGNVGSMATYLESLKGRDGEDGTVGSKNRFESYAPSTELAPEGDAWFHTISATKLAIYDSAGADPVTPANGVWRLRFTSPDPVTNTTGTGGSTNGVTLTSSGDGTKYLANDGSYKTISAGTTIVPEQDLSSNSTTAVPSVAGVRKTTGDLAYLTTTAKADFVSALNEVNSKSASGGTVKSISIGTNGNPLLPDATNKNVVLPLTEVKYFEGFTVVDINHIENDNYWSNATNQYTGPALTTNHRAIHERYASASLRGALYSTNGQGSVNRYLTT
jgi:hypothetical protein